MAICVVMIPVVGWAKKTRLHDDDSDCDDDTGTCDDAGDSDKKRWKLN